MDKIVELLAPKAQMHLVPPGTSILPKLHSEVKYLGSNLLEAAGPKKSVAELTREEVLFLVESSLANMWMVPWLEEAHTRLESGLQIFIMENIKKIAFKWFKADIYLKFME